MLELKVSLYVITGNVCTHCTVYCFVSTKQAHPLLTGLRLRDINATVTSKRKSSYDSGRKDRSGWEMPFVWEQKVAVGSVCSVLHYCT